MPTLFVPSELPDQKTLYTESFSEATVTQKGKRQKVDDFRT